MYTEINVNCSPKFSHHDAIIDIAHNIRPNDYPFEPFHRITEGFYHTLTAKGEILCFSKKHIEDHTNMLNEYLARGEMPPKMVITPEHNIPPVFKTKV